MKYITYLCIQMKIMRSIWIPPSQTTLRQLAELNKQVFYFRDRSKSIGSNLLKMESTFFKKLVGYQSELSSIRNKFVHTAWEKVTDRPDLFSEWQNEQTQNLVLRYHSIEGLIATGIERLALGNQPYLNERFESLENDFIFQYGDDEYIGEVKTPKDITDAKSAILESVQARINEHLYRLRKEVGIRIFRLRLGLAIDRRARFRSIVHGIFKNLDDYDSEDYVMQAA
jgi:hypothetical protein